MILIVHSIQRFLKEENGPTSVEYAVLLGLIIVVSIGIIATFGQQLVGMFTHSSGEIVVVPGANL